MLAGVAQDPDVGTANPILMQAPYARRAGRAITGAAPRAQYGLRQVRE
ncbi:hypothetical protein Psi01_42620 [Planobispora siamensis]|uniref:Uncharacterized protein n=1 Tax=Planobispora siamensis TaxID=936338 RepID=A0A8J3WMM9_9ACTN|nr:hypothetical protein Psi01_42620 [Planobispora siamensis]